MIYDKNGVVFRFVSHSSSGTRPSLETKMMGASGCLEARPNEDRAPLMHMIEERRRENERRHLIQPIVIE